MFPEVRTDDVPWVTTEQMREVDRLMIEEFGIELIQMMENAGRNLADLISGRFGPSSVSVLAGTGGNGGGAMVAARHLHNRGVDVTVSITRPDGLAPVPSIQRDALEAIGVATSDEPQDADLVIDGVLGYSLVGAPGGRAEEFIAWSSRRNVVSLDVPSGVDTTTGARPGRVVQATATATLAAPKQGLRGRPEVGELFLLDISVPPAVWARLDVDPPGPLSPISRLV